jgi:transcriptional regulator with XRE-family HTH domain
MGDDVRVGRMVQDVRLARDLRQEDVADRAGVSRSTISRLERGLVDGMTVSSLRAISRALGMPSILSFGWRSPEVERLRDRLHAAMVEQVVSMLVKLGWESAPERSFNHYGERGSADILAWHAASRALLVVETKSRLYDLQDALVTLDRKRRLLPGLAARDLGWRAQVVGVVLVLPEMSTHRHVVERHAATFRAAFPQRQWEIREWLARPTADLRGLWFLPVSHDDGIGQRARRRRASKRTRGAVRQVASRSGKPDAAV